MILSVLLIGKSYGVESFNIGFSTSCEKLLGIFSQISLVGVDSFMRIIKMELSCLYGLNRNKSTYFVGLSHLHNSLEEYQMTSIVVPKNFRFLQPRPWIKFGMLGMRNLLIHKAIQPDPIALSQLVSSSSSTHVLA
jgi:hypothetical protein